MKPTDIERESFRIIDREAGPHDFTPAQWQIVRRMIHTSADFDYLRTAHFHPQAVAVGLRALRAGKPVITDTNMARTGIRKQDACHFGVDVSCHMDDPAVHAAARSSGTTRAEAAVDAALEEMTDGIYVIGNAPTALFHLLNMLEDPACPRPAAIIGCPVGFIGAAESKEALMQDNPCPAVIVEGRLGGSAITVAAVNALASRKE